MSLLGAAGADAHARPMPMNVHAQLSYALPDVFGDLERRMGAFHNVAAADIAAGRLPPPAPFYPGAMGAGFYPPPQSMGAVAPPYPPFNPYDVGAAAAGAYGSYPPAGYGPQSLPVGRVMATPRAKAQQPLPAAQQPAAPIDTDALTERWKRIVDVLDAERRQPPPMRAGSSNTTSRPKKAHADDGTAELAPRATTRTAKPSARFKTKPQPQQQRTQSAAPVPSAAAQGKPATTASTGGSSGSTARSTAERVDERTLARARHAWGYGGTTTNSIVQRVTVGDPNNAKLACALQAQPHAEPAGAHGPAFTAAGAGATPPTGDELKTSDDQAAAAGAGAGGGQLLLSPSQQRAVQHRARVLRERARVVAAKELDVRRHAHVHAGAHARTLSSGSSRAQGQEQQSTGDWLRVREQELKDMEKQRDLQIKCEQRAEFLALRNAMRNAKLNAATAARRTSPDPPFPRVAEELKAPLQPLPDPSNNPMHNNLLRFDPPHRSELKPELDPYVAPALAKAGQGAGGGAAAPKPKPKTKTNKKNKKPPSTKLKHNMSLLPPRRTTKPPTAFAGAAAAAKPKAKPAHAPVEPPVQVIPTPTFATPTKAGSGLGRRSRSPSPAARTRATAAAAAAAGMRPYDDDEQQEPRRDAVEDELEQFVAQLERQNQRKAQQQAQRPGAEADRPAAAAAAKLIAERASADRAQHRALAEQAMRAWEARQHERTNSGAIAPATKPARLVVDPDVEPDAQSAPVTQQPPARIRFQGGEADDEEEDEQTMARAARMVGHAARLASLPPDYGALLIHGAKTPSSGAAAASFLDFQSGGQNGEPVLVHPLPTPASASGGVSGLTLSQQLDQLHRQQAASRDVPGPATLPVPPAAAPPAPSTSTHERGSTAWFQEMASYLDGMNRAQRTAAEALLRAASSAAEATAAAAAQPPAQPSPTKSAQPSPPRQQKAQKQKSPQKGMASPVPRGKQQQQQSKQPRPAAADVDPMRVSTTSSSLRASISFRDVLRASYETFAASADAAAAATSAPPPQTAQQLVAAAMASYATPQTRTIQWPRTSGVTDEMVRNAYADRGRYRTLHRARNAEAFGGGDGVDDVARDTLDLPRLNTLLSDNLLHELVSHNAAEVAGIYDSYVDALLRSELELVPVVAPAML